MSSGDTRFINHDTITDFQRGCSSDLEFGRRGLPNLSHGMLSRAFFDENENNICKFCRIADK